MTDPVRSLVFRERWRGLVWLASLGAILVLLALCIYLPPDGAQREGWMRFIGQFHPVVVHLPVALILLVPALQIVGRRSHFSHLRKAGDFVLALAMLSAIVAPSLGWLLARSGGYAGPLLIQHMWGGVGVALACWLCLLLSELRKLERIRHRVLPYRAGLLVTVLLLAWTGYRGGQLAHGEDHLIKHMPHPLSAWIGLAGDGTAPTAFGDSSTFYGVRIQPILTEHCVTCHGANGQRGGLQLDAHAALMRGGEGGPVIVAGDVERSELFRRLMLPPKNKEFMPADGRPPLSAYEVKLIELWIAAGASATVAADAIDGLPGGPREVTFEVIEQAAVAKARAPLAPTVVELQTLYPFVLQYQSRSSADLQLNASLLAGSFGDKELANFEPVAQHIVFADLSRTAISDASAQAIAAMERLRVLRLNHTAISDVTVQSVVGLKELESLSVFGTSITGTSYSALDSLPQVYGAHTVADIPANEYSPVMQEGSRSAADDITVSSPDPSPRGADPN